MIDRSQVMNIDWILVSLLLLNSAIGVVAIYSSSLYLPGNYCLKQIIWIIISLVLLFIFLSIDYNILTTYSLFLYILCIVLLGSVLIFGNLIAGTRSWFRLFFFQIQPSEITKIAVILVISRIFSGFKRSPLSWKLGSISSVMVFIPVVLIAFQPDLGTALSFIPIFLGAIILAGINRKALILLLVFALVLGFAGWNFFLKDYQKSRLTTLVSPNKDPLGSGYHVLQSKIAIGSGGFSGKGYMKGTQSQLRFLPARHTDFIFSVIGEEFGFVGVVLAVLAFFFFVYRLFNSVKSSKDRAGVYIIFMVSMMITCQFFVNVLMTIGLFPITGIPLPLFSYGGSSLLTNYLAVSLVLNVKMRRFVNL